MLLAWEDGRPATYFDGRPPTSDQYIVMATEPTLIGRRLSLLDFRPPRPLCHVALGPCDRLGADRRKVIEALAEDPTSCWTVLEELGR